MQQTEVLDAPERVAANDQSHWSWRALQWAIIAFRPDGGWLVLLTCVVLAALPTMALGENRLEDLRRIQVGLDMIGPLAVLACWFWLGWRRPPASVRQRPWRALGAALATLATGVLVLSQVLVGWLPSVVELWRALRNNGWVALGESMLTDWSVMLTRFQLWWQGVRAGGAAQDNLIFAALTGVLFWLVTALMVWLARRYRLGFLAAAPLLWLLGTLLLYTPSGRGLMLSGVLLTVVLHLLLDQERLVRRWQAIGLDFSPGLIYDRAIMVLGIVAAVGVVAALLPNVYYSELVWGYYRLVEPAEQRLEDFRDRLFPALRGSSRLRGGGSLDGLPNEFLLGGGSTLGRNIVMYVRTDDSAGYQEMYGGGAPFDMPAPPGHYMRGVTLTEYDGRGWSNPSVRTRQQHSANERWASTDRPGRKLLVQSVTVMLNSSILYGAPEGVEPGVNYEAELRADGDLVALWSRSHNYTLVSSIPAASNEELAAIPAWGGAQPLPAEYAVHLQLPATISDRTRQLATELTANQPGPYAQAQAIEAYLRQYEYDLAVNEPPADVADVADYFLFDLRKGYCDYYATAYVVLARLAGLPARFASGYAVGSWDPVEGVWIVTEAEAHSWPEVYFLEYGWIPFEPTAGRPELERIGLPNMQVGSVVPAPAPAAEVTSSTARWNWQMLIWLLPLGLLVWLVWRLLDRWKRRREDPWIGLLRWGQRAGRPLDAGETVLEYGRSLAAHIIARQTHAADTGRVAAREVTSLSDAVNQLHYAPVGERSSAVARATEHWQRLRAYLSRL